MKGDGVFEGLRIPGFAGVRSSPGHWESQRWNVGSEKRTADR